MIDNVEVKFDNSYQTPNMYLAACIILVTDRDPDRYIFSDSKVSENVKIYVCWDDRDLLPLKAIKSGIFEINVYELQKIHKRLVNKVFELIRKYKK